MREALSSASSANEEAAVDNLPFVPVDADFKDAESYEVFFPEGSDEPWHVVVGTKENDRFVYWALIQMLQSKDWEADFEWAVFMKTGRSGSSGLRHFSKKFTDGAAALRTFAEWFSEKTGNKWLGDFTSTKESFVELPGKFVLLTPEVAKTVLEHRGDKERERPKLGTTDLPVDIYFKDRNDYQVYVTPDNDLWTAVMSVKVGDRHTQYAIMQVLVAKPDIRVEFDFVVFMRHGKLGGSAQRYAKRYTVEVAALSTFHQWFKEKTGNEWLGSFKDSLESFEPVHGKYTLLPREDWSEVVEFEERARLALIDSDVPVDYYYRDRDAYRVYHTEAGDLWAAVLAEKNEEGYKKFVLLQMLAKRPDATVDFDFVALRRVGERGESGQWTAKKFTNELDALRTFKLWYRDETGCTWQGSYNKSFEEFVAVPAKMSLLPIDKWDDTTREVTFGADSAEAMIGQALKRSAQDPHKQSINASQRVSVDLLKRALSLDKKTDPAASIKTNDSLDASTTDRLVKASSVLQKAGSTARVASSAAAAVKSKPANITKSSTISSLATNAPDNEAAAAVSAVVKDRHSNRPVVSSRGGVTPPNEVTSNTAPNENEQSINSTTTKQERPKRSSTKKSLQAAALVDTGATPPQVVQDKPSPQKDVRETQKLSSATPSGQTETVATVTARSPEPTTSDGKTTRRSKKSSAPTNAAVPETPDTAAAAKQSNTTGGGKQQAAATSAPPGAAASAEEGHIRQSSGPKLSDRSATGRAPPSAEEPDCLFTHRERYTNVVNSVKLTLLDVNGKERFYVMQLLEDSACETGSKEKYCFYIRTGRAGSEGAMNFKMHASLEAGKRSFAKKFQEKTKNDWLGDVSSTLPKFSGIEGEFQLIATA